MCKVGAVSLFRMNLIKGIDLDFGIDFDFRGGWVLWVRFGWDFGLPLKYGIIHSTCNSNRFFVHTISTQFYDLFFHIQYVNNFHHFFCIFITHTILHLFCTYITYIVSFLFC